MPNVRKLTRDEVGAVERRRLGERAAIAAEYTELLSGFEVGDYGEATLAEGEKRLTVRNRLQRAAAGRGLQLVFRRTTGQVMRWKVVEQAPSEAKAEVPAPTPEPAAPAAAEPTPRRRGRKPASEVSQEDPASPASQKRRTRRTQSDMTEEVSPKSGRGRRGKATPS